MSTSEPTLLSQLREETSREFGVAARMLSGNLQGQILNLLAALTRAQDILELGTFTG
jgi:predicted O-methyltransferase YrrM